MVYTGLPVVGSSNVVLSISELENLNNGIVVDLNEKAAVLHFVDLVFIYEASEDSFDWPSRWDSDLSDTAGLKDQIFIIFFVLVLSLT